MSGGLDSGCSHQAASACVQLRHWKRRRTIARRLIRLGVRPDTAWGGVYGGHKSTRTLSYTTCADRSLDNAHFARRGLLSLAQLWKEKQA